MLGGHVNAVNTVAFLPDGRLASAGWDRTVIVWDVTSGRQLAVLRGHTGAVARVACSPCGRWLASGDGEQIHVWDATTLGPAFVMTAPGYTRSLAFTPDGRRLVSGHLRAVKVWSPATGQEVLTLPIRAGEVMAAAFTRDGRRLVIGGSGNTVAVWEADPEGAEAR